MVADDLHRAAEVLGLAFGDYGWTRWVVDGRDHVHRIADGAGPDLWLMQRA